MWVLRETSPAWGTDHASSQSHGRRSHVERWEPGTGTVHPSCSSILLIHPILDAKTASGPAVFGVVSLSVNKIWIFQVKHLSWTQQLSSSHIALPSALPQGGDFSRERTPVSPFWMTFAPCIKAKMSSFFLKRVTHTENIHTKMTHTSLNCHSQGCAAKRACKCHRAWFSSFLSPCDYDMCWYLLCEITTDIGHFRKCKETANRNICNIIKASIMLVWA